jgi:hypothetical protein
MQELAQAALEDFDKLAARQSQDTAPAAQAHDTLVEGTLIGLLPGTYYMDLPDGGSVTVLEQLRRMSEDAAKWRQSQDTAVQVGDVVIRNATAVVKHWNEFGPEYEFERAMRGLDDALAARQSQDTTEQADIAKLQQRIKELEADRDNWRDYVESGRVIDAPHSGAETSEAARNAERYRWLQGKTRGAYGVTGDQEFILPHVARRPGQDIMRGSVAEHLDSAIDAAIAAERARQAGSNTGDA